jgi:hypothetical protein
MIRIVRVPWSYCHHLLLSMFILSLRDLALMQ